MNFFEKYPQYNNLRALVPDAVIENEIAPRAEEFEAWLARARQLIPTVNLSSVFDAEIEAGSICMENFLGHWGNVSIEELCKICLIVKWLRPKRILELGTYNGMTTLQMAINAPPDCTTYTLDLPANAVPAVPMGLIDQLVAKHFRERFNTRTGSYFEGRKEVNIVQLLGDTATFDYSVLGGLADIVFIDAAHDYTNKKLDSENALRLLAPNGVIIWHNYADVGCPEVTKYLLELAQTKQLFHLRNTMLVIYRAGAEEK